MRDNRVITSVDLPGAKRAEQAVAYHDRRYFSFGEFQAAAGFWVKRFKAEPHRRYALFTDKAYPFAVLLLALCHSRKEIWIPGNNCPGTARQLQEQGCQLLGSWPAGQAPDYHLLDGSPEPELSPFDPAETRLVIFTSGSTGEAKPITKSLLQLQREVSVLESMWGSRLGAAEVLSTVSHQHIYGLLFRILWPLAAGRCFHSEIYLNPEILINKAQDRPACWVASPAHLKRLHQDSPWPALAKMKTIFSSGGSLPEAAARQVEEKTGQPVLEIYGSSETGGIAWRERESVWTLFPGMTLTGQDKRWQLSSPYLPDGLSYALDDDLSLTGEGRFLLHGRVDRIVKIEEKRLSLRALEERLLALDAVSESAVYTLSQSRDIAVAVVALSDAGAKTLAAQGRAALIKQMRTALREWFEPVVLPRKWLFVDRIPLTAQGKIDRVLLTGLLETDISKFPRILSLKQLGETRELVIKMPKERELVYFQGHFDGYPILPGVVQLAWAEHFGKLLFRIDQSGARFSHLEVIKFLQVIRPEEELTLTLNWNAANGELSFKFSSGARDSSSGRMLYQCACAA